MPEIRSALSAGEQVAGYQILGLAGAGGMGVVYRALDTKLQRTVALKFLPAELNASEKDKERFLREARTASSLDHANIGVIHSVEETADGHAFIVMAFYEGESLSQKIRSGPLRFYEAIDIAIQVARGLAEAHSRHIVHRDVKPSNVMLTSQGAAKIVDFGLSRVVISQSMTQTGGVTGTVSYMSPEQALGKAVDQRTDIWALGVVLAEMLTGRNPFERESVPSIVVAILNEPPRKMEGVPAGLQQIVYRALSKDPAQRYQNCAEILSDLERARVQFGSPPAAVDPSAPTRSIGSGELQKYIQEASKSAWFPVGRERPAKFRWWLATAVGVVLVVVSLMLIPSARQSVFGSLFAGGEKHIAVLPFDNIGNNPANDPLAEGLMDSLAGKLSDLDVGGKSLWVVPTSEVRSRKISDPTSALRELGATLVVKGSIARDGQDVHLTVNLIDPKNLRQIGSASLEDRAGDLAALQDDAVSHLAKLMHINITVDMLKNTGGSVTPAAYEGYLSALGYMHRYDKPGNLDLAVAALNDALKADPRFALGYAELGEAYRLKYRLDSNPKWIDEALANSQKAAQLDDHLPVIYDTLAHIHEQTGNHDLAVQEYEHSLQLNPRGATALVGMARAYENAGRIRDAEATLQKAAALRSDYWDVYSELGLFYDRQRRYPDAVLQLQHAIELTPDNAQLYSNLAAVYLDMADAKVFPQAEEALKKAIALSPSFGSYANLGNLYLQERRYGDSAAMSEKAVEMNSADVAAWNNLATAYEALKNNDKAAAARDRQLELLEDAVKVQGQDAQTQAALGFLYARKKLRDKALVHAQAALALSPDDPSILVYVGETYEALGERSQALRYIAESLKKGYALQDLKDDPDLQTLLSDPNFHTDGK
jgi:eukaryotic-like serine/threonine-protein kinase